MRDCDSCKLLCGCSANVKSRPELVCAQQAARCSPLMRRIVQYGALAVSQFARCIDVPNRKVLQRPANIELFYYRH
jgi:hypothetical protein